MNTVIFVMTILISEASFTLLPIKNLIGFDFSSLSIEDKKICLSEAQLIVSSTAVNDWFDVHGYLKAGEFTIALGHLLTNVKTRTLTFVYLMAHIILFLMK